MLRTSAMLRRMSPDGRLIFPWIIWDTRSREMPIRRANSVCDIPSSSNRSWMRAPMSILGIFAEKFARRLTWF